MRICTSYLVFGVTFFSQVNAYALEPQDSSVSSASAEAPLPPRAIMRLGETRFRPGVRISHLAFSRDAKQLASLGHSIEHRLSIWDANTGKELHTRSLDEHPIYEMCWGADRQGLAVVSKPGSKALERFGIWSFTDILDKPATVAKPSIRKLQGKVVVAKGAAIGKQGLQPEIYHLFAFSADGAILAACGSGGDNPAGFIDLFEAKPCESGTQLRRLGKRGPVPPGSCSGLQFTRKGEAVVILITTEKKTEQTVAVWEVRTRSVSKQFSAPVGLFQGSRQTFDVAEDGSALAIGLEDGTIKVFDLSSGKERLSVKKHDGGKVGRPWSEVCAVKFVNGGRNVLSAGRDDCQLVWDARTGADVASLNGHKSWVEAVAVAPDGKRVATAGQDSLIRLWDAVTWQPILPPRGPYSTIWRLEISRDAKYVAGGCIDGTHVWEAATGREVLLIPTKSWWGDALFSPEGNLLSGDPKGASSLYTLPGGAPKALDIKGRLLDFTPNGKHLLTAVGNSVFIWNWPAGTKKAEAPTGGEASSAAISPDSKLAVVRLEKKGTCLINLDTGTVIRELGMNLHWFARAAGFGLDGAVVNGTVGRDRAEAWSVTTSRRLRLFERPPVFRARHHFYILSFAVSADGRRAASCQNDGGVTVYETVTGQVLAHFGGHRSEAIAVALSPDGKRVFSGGEDHQVLVWDASLAKLAGDVKPLEAPVRTMAWDQLAIRPAKEVIKTMAALALDREGTVAFLKAKLRPAKAADIAILERIFRDLDDPRFAVRDKATRELNDLGMGAVPAVRERVGKTQSAEFRQRANQFLRRFDVTDLTPEQIRLARALEILAAMNTPAARDLVASLAGGARGVWQTDVARRVLDSMDAPASRISR